MPAPSRSSIAAPVAKTYFPSFRLRPDPGIQSVDVRLAPSTIIIYGNFFNSAIMYRRRGYQINSLSRRIQARTAATATKPAVGAHISCQQTHSLHTLTRCFAQISARPDGWDVPSSRSKLPLSPLATPSPAGLGKWAPPISKWAKPNSQKNPAGAENPDRPVLPRRNPRTFRSPGENHRPKPSVSFIQPRGAPAPGKWSKPPGLTSQKSTPSTSANRVMGETIMVSSRVLEDVERNKWTNPRRDRESGIGGSYHPFIQSQENERAPRQNRHWEPSSRYKSRGSLLTQQGDRRIPPQYRVHNVKTAPKPKIHKAKNPLRVNPDINIPSTVSVGNFARLLSVSLSKGNRSFWNSIMLTYILGRLQQVMVHAGMEGQSSYDHGM